MPSKKRRVCPLRGETLELVQEMARKTGCRNEARTINYRLNTIIEQAIKSWMKLDPSMTGPFPDFQAVEPDLIKRLSGEGKKVVSFRGYQRVINAGG